EFQNTASDITYSYVVRLNPLGHRLTSPRRMKLVSLNDRAMMLKNGYSVTTTTRVRARALNPWKTRYPRVICCRRGVGRGAGRFATGITIGSSPPCGAR